MPHVHRLAVLGRADRWSAPARAPHRSSALAVAADHVVAEIGQTDCADQELVEVLLLVDDGVAQCRGILDRRDEVRRRVAVGVQRRHRRLDVVSQVRQARFDLGQQRVEVDQRLAELLAAAVERRRDRAEGLVELGGIDLVQHL